MDINHASAIENSIAIFSSLCVRGVLVRAPACVSLLRPSLVPLAVVDSVSSCCPLHQSRFSALLCASPAPPCLSAAPAVHPIWSRLHHELLSGMVRRRRCERRGGSTAELHPQARWSDGGCSPRSSRFPPTPPPRACPLCVSPATTCSTPVRIVSKKSCTTPAATAPISRRPRLLVSTSTKSNNPSRQTHAQRERGEGNG